MEGGRPKECFQLQCSKHCEGGGSAVADKGDAVPICSCDPDTLGKGAGGAVVRRCEETPAVCLEWTKSSLSFIRQRQTWCTVQVTANWVWSELKDSLFQILAQGNLTASFCLFAFSYFETESHCVALAGPRLAVYTRLTLYLHTPAFASQVLRFQVCTMLLALLDSSQYCNIRENNRCENHNSNNNNNNRIRYFHSNVDSCLFCISFIDLGVHLSMLLDRFLFLVFIPSLGQPAGPRRQDSHLTVVFVF